MICKYEINGSINIGRAMKAETDTTYCIIRTLSVSLWNYEKISKAEIKVDLKVHKLTENKLNIQKIF
jgi:hypothetical protein